MFLPQPCHTFTRMLLILEWLTVSTSSELGCQGKVLDCKTPIHIFAPCQMRTLKAKRQNSSGNVPTMSYAMAIALCYLVGKSCVPGK